MVAVDRPKELQAWNQDQTAVNRAFLGHQTVHLDVLHDDLTVKEIG